ncbi:redox-regulated ATPase YchF [Candidatus Azambacteria bacterium]|nr:redox-regulated ATPase YchF [Candidatus Azambacteria bacterium]
MSFSIGIVGLPNVGKSTLFKALTKKQVDIQNYPFCTIDPNVGVVTVPDERLDKLAAFSHSKKTVPTVIEFFDIAGLVKGAHEGEGLGNQFLSHIKETKAIAHVVNLELIFADLAATTRRLEKNARDARAGVKEAVAQKATLEKIKTALETGALAHTLSFTDQEIPFVKELNLLTSKPILYVLNKKTGAKNVEGVTAYLSKNNLAWVMLDANTELMLGELQENDRKEYQKEFGLSEQSGLDDLIKKSYELLGLITYLTTGEDETRAWTIRRGTKAPQAAAEIHTDFEKKFIRAEVINWQILLDAGSYAAAREKGLLRTEGKEYVVKDGDVMEFKI